jgi:hypothetical protein
MHRRLLNLLSALSLLLCVAVCAVWVRSYCAQDVVLFPFARHASGVYSSCGQVLIRFGGFANTPGRGVRLIRDRATCFDDAGRAGALVGFGYVRFAQPPGWSVLFPHWVLATAAAGPAALAAAARLRRGRAGFEVTPAANAGPNACPECAAENRALISN